MCGGLAACSNLISGSEWTVASRWIFCPVCTAIALTDPEIETIDGPIVQDPSPSLVSSTSMELNGCFLKLKHKKWPQNAKNGSLCKATRWCHQLWILIPPWTESKFQNLGTYSSLGCPCGGIKRISTKLYMQGCTSKEMLRVVLSNIWLFWPRFKNRNRLKKDRNWLQSMNRNRLISKLSKPVEKPKC